MRAAFGLPIWTLTLRISPFLRKLIPKPLPQGASAWQLLPGIWKQHQGLFPGPQLETRWGWISPGPRGLVR